MGWICDFLLLGLVWYAWASCVWMESAARHKTPKIKSKSQGNLLSCSSACSSSQCHSMLVLVVIKTLAMILFINCTLQLLPLLLLPHCCHCSETFWWLFLVVGEGCNWMC